MVKTKSPKEGTYYTIKVKGSRKNTEYKIDYATYQNGEWLRRVWFDGSDEDGAFVDRNSGIGYDYEPLGEGLTVTSYEEMEDQDEVTEEDIYD